MAEWKEPKSDYKRSDPVTPEIFNELAANEKHLKEISCKVEFSRMTGETSVINSLVLLEVR